MEKKRCTAVVLAAGSGSRMKSDVAKQYMLLRGRPLIWYALHAIEESSVIDDCILVTGAEDISYVAEEIVERYGLHKVSDVIAGGQERYDSVYNALKVLAGRASGAEEDGYVFIHDGARPFLTEEILRRCLAEVEKTGACVAGMPVKDTIKIADTAGYAVQTPERSFVWQIQTPQVFELGLIVQAYEAFAQDGTRTGTGRHQITDDAMVVENYTGKRVSLVQGSYENIKITTPEDLVIAEALLRHGEQEACLENK